MENFYDVNIACWIVVCAIEIVIGFHMEKLEKIGEIKVTRIRCQSNRDQTINNT